MCQPAAQPDPRHKGPRGRWGVVTTPQRSMDFAQQSDTQVMAPANDSIQFTAEGTELTGLWMAVGATALLIAASAGAAG